MRDNRIIRPFALVSLCASAVFFLHQLGDHAAYALEPAQKTDVPASGTARSAVRQPGTATSATPAEIEARRRERRVSSWPVQGTGVGPGTTGTVRPDRLPGNNVVPLTPQECVGLGGTIVQTGGCASDDPLTSGYACQVQTRERNGNRVSVVVRQMCITQIG